MNRPRNKVQAQGNEKKETSTFKDQLKWKELSKDEIEKLKLKHAIKQSDLRFRTLFESAHDAIFMMQGPHFIDCNTATERIFGCKKNQIIGQTPLHFSPEEQPSGLPSSKAAIEKIQKALDGFPQFFEWQHKKFDGTCFDAEVSLNRMEVGDEFYVQAIVRDITARKKKEAENELLAMVANTTNNMVIIADAYGRAEWVNDTFTAVTGYSFDEIKGMKPGSLLQGPGSDPKTKAYISSQLKEGKAVKDVEILNYKKNRTPYWVNISIQPKLDDAGKVTQYIAIENDITLRKNAQLALADREKRYSNLVHKSPMGIIEWDMSLNILEWNEAAEKIFGYSREEALGNNASDLILTHEQRANIEHVLKALIDIKGGERSTNQNMTKDGDTISCEWYNSVLLDDYGAACGIISIVEDITDKLKAENRIKESELRLRQIVENSPLGIHVYIVNQNDQLILSDSNSAADKLTGIDNSKLIGLTIEEAFPGLKNTILPSEFLKVTRHGQSWTSDTIEYNEEEISGAFQVTAFQAGINRVAVVFNNITKRIQDERDLKRKNDELVKINVELDRFVYSASHDLRAPIASLLGLIEVARLEKDTNSISRLLDYQEQNLVKLDNFIQDIVNYSRNSRLKVQTSEIDFKNLIADSYNQLDYMNRLNNVDKRIMVDPDINFRSDSKRIEILINNLVSNAIKYADKSKDQPFVEVNVEEHSSGVVITVKDNGTGIEESELPKIFDMFYRGTELSKGSGIGLYIVKEIVEKLKGTIEVSSKVGVGTNFHIYLPTRKPGPNRVTNE